MTPEQKRQFIDTSYMQAIRVAQIGNDIFRKTEEDRKKRQEQFGI